MKSEVIIRKAVKADISQLLELYKELQPEDPPVDENEANAVWDKTAAGSGIIYFVAESDGRIVATCYIAIIPNITRRCSPIGFIENIVTASSYRRLGIAGKLVAEAVEYAKAQGCYKVTLQSNTKRKDAHEFYEAAGFDGNSKRAFEIRF